MIYLFYLQAPKKFRRCAAFSSIRCLADLVVTLSWNGASAHRLHRHANACARSSNAGSSKRTIIVLSILLMCGITAVLGEQPAVEVLMTGLQRLEYRGYDSAGCAVLEQSGQISTRKAVGKVSNLKSRSTDLVGTIGIAHTRWATHGPPNEVNAHPHVASDGSFALVHNGIIENYSVLKAMLQSKGYIFLSETDTEVLVHLLSFVHKEISIAAAPSRVPLSDAIPATLLQIVGTYGIAIVSQEDGGTLFAARMGSPLILGVGESSFHIARSVTRLHVTQRFPRVIRFISDATAFMDITRTSIVLEDGQWAQVKRGDKMFRVRNMQQEEQAFTLETIIGDISLVEKGGFDHHMIKEITRQPESLANCMRGRVSADGHLHLGGLTAAINHNGQSIIPLNALRAARQVHIHMHVCRCRLVISCCFLLKMPHRSPYAPAGPAGTRRLWAST
jgi:glucosamine 6-phosphate synthetase-like amidotransferase/phosphosugar isomerase protein